MTPPAALETKGLRKTYRLSRTNVHEALRGVDLIIPRGSFASIIGPSGSGKSTLMNLVSTLDRPTSGTVLVDGVDTAALDDGDLSRLRNAKIGVIFQSYNLIQRMTALQNVMLPLVAAEVEPAERERRALEALGTVGLAARTLHRPVELSGGEQQRVSIARALVTNPAIVLADEPTGNLDTKTTVSILDLLESINRDAGVTTVLVTHDLAVARRTRRVIRLRDGLVEADLDPKELTP